MGGKAYEMNSAIRAARRTVPVVELVQLNIVLVEKNNTPVFVAHDGKKPPSAEGRAIS